MQATAAGLIHRLAALGPRLAEPLRRTGGWYPVLIAATGLAGGLAGVLLRVGLRGFQTLYFASTDNILEIAQRLWWPWRLAAPAGGALIAAMLIRHGLKGQAGEGMSEVLEAVALKGRALSIRRSLWKGLASLVAIGSGGSLGREGPMTQIGAAVAARIGETLRISVERRRILIGCGVAAGMAAAYNAPIGASFFVMEVIIGNFAMDVFGPVVIAAVVATLVSRGIVAGPIYEVPDLTLVSAWEFVPYLLLGLSCALVGRAFIGTMSAVTWLFGRTPLPPVARAVAGGLGVGAIAVWIPHVWGNGHEGVNLALSGEMLPGALGAALAGKLLATALSIGSGSSGGVFTPSLFLGAMLGSLVGHGAHALWPASSAPPAAYALVGMSGLLAATTHAPIMSTLIAFETSLNYNLILPVMVCTGVAALVSRAIDRDSIYTARLRRRGIDLDLAIEETALLSIKVEDVMWPHPLTVPSRTPLREMVETFLRMRGAAIHVVDEDRRYVGTIDVHDLMAAAERKELGDVLIAGDLARRAPHVQAGDPVARVTERFWFQEHGELPVLSEEAPLRFLGVVTRRDVLRAFDREVLQRRFITARYAAGDADASPRKAFDLPVEFAVQEVAVTDTLAGRTLSELDLPHKFLLTVLSIKPGGDAGSEVIPPPVDVRLSAGDRLVLVGRRRDLARFVRDAASRS